MTSSVFRYLNLLAIAAATNWIWTSLASSFNPQETLTSAICGTSQIADANIPYVISSNLKYGESPIKHCNGSWHRKNCREGVLATTNSLKVGYFCIRRDTFFALSGSFRSRTKSCDNLSCGAKYVPLSFFLFTNSWDTVVNSI